MLEHAAESLLLYHKALDSIDTARDGSFKAELPAQY